MKRTASGALEPYWPAPQECTFEEALSAGRDVVQQCTAAIPSLPPKDYSKPSCASLSEALAIYHAREDKKGQGKTAKSKKQSASALDHGYPGARQGAGEPSAFWMYVEVS